MFDWVKLCIISDHNIAIGWYRNSGEKPPTTTVCVFTATHESWLEGFSIKQMEGTTRIFRRRQRKIARWYYKELCRSFKDGIVVVSGSKKTSLGRWD